MLKSDNATERLCGPEFEMIFKTNANSTAQETICGGDRKMVLAEMMLFAAVFEHQYNQQVTQPRPDKQIKHIRAAT